MFLLENSMFTTIFKSTFIEFSSKKYFTDKKWFLISSNGRARRDTSIKLFSQFFSSFCLKNCLKLLKYFETYFSTSLAAYSFIWRSFKHSLLHEDFWLETLLPTKLDAQKHVCLAQYDIQNRHIRVPILYQVLGQK